MADQTWDLDVDFVAVGSGLGGLSAAIHAHDLGAKVAILDKSAKLGGVCAYSGGEVFVPCNHKMAEAGIEDTPDAALRYLQFLGGGYEDPALQAILLETGPEATRYMEERAGVPWKTIRDFPDYHHPHAPGTAERGRYLEVELMNGAELGEWQERSYRMSPHMPPGVTHDEVFGWGSFSDVLDWDFTLMGKRMSEDRRGFGPGMMGHFLKAALVDRNISAFTQSPASELISEGGRVIGIRATRDGNDFFIRTRKGVLLAVGGYDWHPDFPRHFEGLPEWNSMCQPNVEGDNVVLGGEVGAALAGVPSHNLGMFFGYQVPGEEHEGRPLFRASWEGGYPHAIWVNRKGERFADESFYRDYLPRLHAWDGITQTHPNYPPYLIFDQDYRDRYPLGSFMPGQDLPEALVAQADTPEALAEKLGIDANGLQATLRHFNSFAGGDTDPDFGRGTYPWARMMIGDRARPNPNMGPVERAPFYGLALRPVGAGINAVGLRTDANGQVLHVRGHAIGGLYAAGNSAAPLDTGAGYQSGLSNLRGLTWGYIAGRHALEAP